MFLEFGILSVLTRKFINLPFYCNILKFGRGLDRKLSRKTLTSWIINQEISMREIGHFYQKKSEIIFNVLQINLYYLLESFLSLFSCDSLTFPILARPLLGGSLLIRNF